MTYLQSVIEKEEKRNNNMINEYLLELDSLPKGSIKEKKVKNNVYYYLNYRDGNKVISKYIGKEEKLVNQVKEQLNRRKQIEELLKLLYKERTDIKKMEAML